MTHELEGWVRARPLRVAFLVEDGEHIDLTLDGIFADCYDRWGGRFSLIAPCVNGQISPAYWPWLETYDPDVVYSYVSLSRVAILEIHERLCPSEYIYHEFHGEPPLDVFGFKPSYDFSLLSSLSIIFRLARFSSSSAGGPPVKIIDSWHSESPSRFLTDNFGTYHISRGSGIFPKDAAATAGLATICSSGAQSGQRLPSDVVPLPDEATAVTEFIHRRAISLSLASILFAPKLDIRSERWSSSFNLVVGDSFADRLLFWNARLLIPSWLDNDLCCLRVDMSQLRNPEFLAVLGDFLKLRNHVTAGSGGQPQLAVRSASLNTDELSEALTLVNSTKSWSAIRAEPINNLETFVPSDNALRGANQSNRYVESGRGGVTRFAWLPPVVHPPVALPDHLSDVPSRQSFGEGYWCNDFSFQHDGPGPGLGADNRWVLPRRWRLAGAFETRLLNASTMGTPPSPRRGRHGKLAIPVSSDHPVDSLKIPTVYEAIRYAMCGDGARADPSAQHGRVHPPSKVAWCERSNEARYFIGVLGLTGGLQRAHGFLLHPFLRDIFSSFGGTPNLPPEKVIPTANRLQKRTRSNPVFDLRQKEETQCLADLITKAARSLKAPIEFVRFEELQKAWRAYRDAYWIAHPQSDNEDDDYWDKQEEASLEACLVSMRRQKIIFQGHQWTCRNCHHRNWVDLADLSTDLSCEVCKFTVQAPVAISWLFRPNEFLVESLRDHSVLSLIWSLSALRLRARDSFLFAEPSWFGFDPETSKRDAEADLLVVIDGQATLCEVKSSWHSLRRSHIADLVALAIRLRPDAAVLAVMESGQGPANELEDARRRLAAEGIKFELITTDQYSPQDDPFLLSDEE